MASDLRSRIFVKKNGGLFPGDADASTAFAKMKDGAGYLVNLHRPRNISHHRKLFALLSLVQDHAIDLICKQVLDMSRDDLLAEIGDILAGRRAA